MPARVKGKAREVSDHAKQTAAAVVDQAQQKAQDASRLVAHRMPDVVKQHSGRTAALAAGMLLVGLVVAGALTRRSG